MYKRFFTSLILGVSTFLLIGATKTYVPYSPIKDAIIDVLTVPGALIAGIAYPEGIHTGSGSASWALWAMVANLIVYVLFWYVVVRLYQQHLLRKGPR